jgi:hypothetical protein
LPPGTDTLLCGSSPQLTMTAGVIVTLDCDLAVV